MNCYRAKSLGHSSRVIWVVTGPQLGVRSTILGPPQYLQIHVVTQPQRGVRSTVIEANPWVILPEKSIFGL